MTLYIEDLMPLMPGTVDTPSVAVITLPDGSSFQALLSSDVSVQLSNHFGNLLPGTEVLAGLAQAIGAVNIPSWIGASVQGWRGTDPIKFTLDMFLVNYKPHLNYEKSLKKLASLATVSPSSRTGALAHVTHQVHGGYETNASAFASNVQFFEKSASMYLESKKDGNVQQDDTRDYLNLTNLGNETLSRTANFKGTLTIKIGSRFTLKNLIMTSITITPSVVEVYSHTAGERPKPLYYKISASFMTCRAALSTDIALMFQE